MPIQQLSEVLCTIQQNQALMMQKLLAPPPATLAPRRVVNFKPFKSGPSSSYLEPSTSYQQPNTSYKQPSTSYQQPQFFPGYQENRSSPKMLSTPAAIHTPPTRSQAPKVFSPQHSLAQDYFFGKEEMAQHTAGKLNSSRMQRIRSIMLSKFGGRRSLADKEVLWARCKVAIGHKCKQLRSNRRL